MHHSLIAHLAQLAQHQCLPGLNKPHLCFDDIAPIMHQLAHHPEVSSQLVGHSFNGTPIYRLSVGHGPLVVLGWTQMHGNEPTATAAVLDWLSLLVDQPEFSPAEAWQHQCTIHMIVMLNPDGARLQRRENAQGIDINRDASVLQSPEGALLMRQVEQLKPLVAFNLHDQNPYYAAGPAGAKPSTLAFLAPPFDAPETIDTRRKRAMQLIAAMYQGLRAVSEVGLARYIEGYSPRCFGDNIAAHCSTILIESGACLNDPNRQQARSLNVVALQLALTHLLHNTLDDFALTDYLAIPENKEDGYCDIVLRHVCQQREQQRFFTDIAINHSAEAPYALITAIGDLQPQQGFIEIDCDGLTLLPAKGVRVAPGTKLTEEIALNWLKAGYNHISQCEDSLTQEANKIGLKVQNSPQLYPFKGDTAALILARNGKPEIAIIGARVWTLKD